MTAAAALALAVLVPLAVLQPGQPALAALSGAPAESRDPAGDGPGASPGSWSLAQIRDSIEDANHRIVESITSRDLDSIADRYSPDVVVHAMGGVPRHGRVQVEALYREVYERGFRKLRIETLELRRLDDDLVYELGRFTYDHKDGRTSLNGRFQTVWRYEDGRWLVYRDMSNF